MITLPLRLGPLSAAPYLLRRSGIRWLRRDGDACDAGEVVGYCQLRVESGSSVHLRRMPFESERTLQVALAPTVAGTLRLGRKAHGGGYLDVLGIQDWNPDEVVAGLDVEGDATSAEGALRLLLLAGERVGWALDVDSGLLPGWNRLARAWWSGAQGPAINMIVLGVCDATGFMRGDESGFVELFAASRTSACIAHATEHPMAPCARTILEQQLRTSNEREAILEDIGRALGGGAPTAADLTFMGALASQLSHSPTLNTQEIITPVGLKRQPPPKIVLMSALSEPKRLLRHRRLGYHLQIFEHNRRSAGPLVGQWLKTAFEPVTPGGDDLRADLTRLSSALRDKTGAKLLVINLMSTSGRETVDNYSPFDPPLDRSLVTVGAKVTNLVLEDLADEGVLTVVDLDALAAELGGAVNLPDGIHQGGLLQAAMREEVLNLAGNLSQGD